MEGKSATTLHELSQRARDILDLLSQKDLHTVGLSGDLGAGKTALTKAIAGELGIKEDITSPTFVVMKSYPIREHARFTKLVHIDAYRIESEDEMRVLKFNEVVDNPQSLVVIEWPERIEEILPKDTLRISIEIEEGETRTISYAH